jgi:hypothetical protein
MNNIIDQGAIHLLFLTVLNYALHLLPDVEEQVPSVFGLIDEGP